MRELAERNGISIDEAYAQLKENYDGYHFSPVSPDIYNPFSLLSALKTLRTEDYGFSSDIPTSLVDMIRSIKAELQDPENLEEDIDNLMNGSFDMGNILSLMYQRGHLTIKGYDTRFNTVSLGYPNREAERSIHNICCRSVPTDAR